MKAHLIQIDATNPVGVAVSLYLSSVDDASCCHLGGQQWIPAIARLPALRYDFFGGDFSGAIASPSASFAVATDGLPAFNGLRFAGARFRLWTGELGDAWGGYTLRFDGRITAEPTFTEGSAQFDAGPDDAWLDRPLLALYTGNGGAEGPDDLEGQPKPLVLGNCRFVPGTLVDAVDNVWQVSGYGAVQAVGKTYDRVVALGGPVANYTSYAGLLAASIPNGSTATCRALGLVRMGAPPDGQVSFDVSGDNAGAGGYVRRPGALIRRLAEIAGGTVDNANLAALDTARPYNLALVLTDQTTAREVIQQLADSVCAVAGVSWTGALFVQPLGYGMPTITLASDGTALPPVASVEVQPVGTPFWRLATEAEISWVVHGRGEVASEYVLRGLYNVARVYRLDDLVERSDGSTWVYINATASSGNVPPTWPTTSNSWWRNTSPPTAAIWDEITGSGKDAVDSTIKPGGGVANDQVTTPAVVAGSMSADQVFTSADTYSAGGSGETVFLETGTITVGDASYSTALLNLNFTMDGSLVGQPDSGALYRMYVDTGSGWVLSKGQILGVSASGGNISSRLSGQLQSFVGSNASFKVRGTVISNNDIPASVKRNTYVRDITLTVGGAKR